MAIGSVLDVNSTDTILSILPIHHVFECTVGFLFSLYKGAQTVFCDGIRHVVENLNEYKVTVIACVPGIYERIDLYDMGIIETVIKESIENYTTEKELLKNITDKIKQEIQTTVQELKSKTKDEIVEERYQKFRKISGFKEV